MKGNRFEAMRIRIAQPTGNVINIPDKHRPQVRISALESTVVRSFAMASMGGMMMSMPHSMHLHDVQFQILSRNGTGNTSP